MSAGGDEPRVAIAVRADVTPPRRRSALSSVAMGSALGVVGAAASTVGGFLFVLAATRGLGATGSGVLFVAVALFTVLGNVGKLGADTSLVRFVARALSLHRPGEVRWLLRIGVVASAGASVVVTAILLLLAHPLARLLYSGPANPTQVRLVQLVAVCLPMMTLTLVLLAVTRGFGTVGWFVLVEQLLKPLSRPVLVAGVCLAGGGVVAAMVGWLAPVALGLLLAAYAAQASLLRLDHWVAEPDGDDPLEPVEPPPPSDPGARRREFWGFAAPRAVGGTLEILAPWLGVLLLSALASSADAGVFTAVTRVVTAGTMALVAMRLALGPHLSAAFGREDHAELDRLHEHSTIWAVLASFPLFLTVAVFPETVLSVFGPAFPGGATALVVLVAANLLNVAVGNVQSVVLMGGRSSWNLVNTAAALGTQVVLGLLLIPPFGLVGAAIGLSAGVVVNNGLSVWQAGRGLGVRVWTGRIGLAIGLTALTFLPVQLGARLLLGPSWPALVVSTLVASGLLLTMMRARPRTLGLTEGWRVLTRRFTPGRGTP